MIFPTFPWNQVSKSMTFPGFLWTLIKAENYLVCCSILLNYIRNYSFMHYHANIASNLKYFIVLDFFCLIFLLILYKFLSCVILLYFLRLCMCGTLICLSVSIINGLLSNQSPTDFIRPLATIAMGNSIVSEAITSIHEGKTLRPTESSASFHLFSLAIRTGIES